MKNYKKILAFALLSLILISSLTLISFAEDEKATIDEKFTSVTYKGEEYMVVPQDVAWTLELNFEDVEFSEIKISFSESQEKIIKNYSTTEYYNKDGKLAVLEISYFFMNSDTVLTLTYLDTSTYNDFTDLFYNMYSGDDAYVEIMNNTSFFTYTTIDTCYSDLKKGKSYNMTPFNLNNYNFMYVYRNNASHEISVGCGILVFENSNKKYYYLDYAENDLKPNETPDTLLSKGFTVHEVYNSDLIAALNEELGIKTDDNELDFDTDYTDSFAFVMVILAALVFGIVPLVIAIICFVKAPKMESPYCGLMKAIAIVCSIITFFVLLVLIFFLL